MPTDPMDHAPARTPVSGRPTDLSPRGSIPATRCKAHNRLGEPCGRWAIIGGQVCSSHGGNSPQAQRGAQARIRELVAPALTVSERLLTDPDTPPAVLQRLVADILDRSGHKAVDVSVSVVEDAGRRDLGAAMAKVLADRGIDVPEVIDVEPVEPEAWD